MSDLIKSIQSKLEALKGGNKKTMESRTEADPASPEARRQRSIDKIRSMGIAYTYNLPLLESADEVTVRPFDDICKRAAACLFAVQLACDISQGNEYEDSKEFFSGLLERYGVSDSLLEKEKLLFDNNFTEQDAVDITWSYECYWALVWALGLIEDMGEPSECCDCETAVRLLSECKDMEEFKSKCRPRDINEILDVLDLYYRYHWACVNKQIDPDTPINGLDPAVVTERRRGLEWLINDEDDWNDISLDT